MSDYHVHPTMQDSLSPEELAALAQSFGLEDVEAIDYCEGSFIEDEYLERLMGYCTSQYLWDAMWRFGIVLDEDYARVQSLGNYWRPDGVFHRNTYYVPDDYLSEISIDNPPKLLSIAEQEAAA